THSYIMTGNEDSKFGFNLSNGQAEQAFNRLKNHSNMRIKGLHCHIGSQIFETDRYLTTTDLLFKELAKWHETYRFIPEVLNLGGGFGIRYTKDDPPISYQSFVENMVENVKHHVKQMQIPMPEIWIEPGRSIAGNTALTLSTV